MRTSPKISCVLPVYNGEELLSRSIESVMRQSFTDWELIIVNDCSTDSSLSIAHAYAAQDERIRVINNEHNLKLPRSLNAGFAAARGEYWTWTSDDNEYYPEAFEKMARFLDRNLDFGMVYAQTHVEENGVLLPCVWCDRQTTAELLLHISVPGACFLYRAAAARSIGPYDAGCFLNEDHDFWLRMYLHTRIGNIEEPLYLYRLTTSGLTNTRRYDIRRGKLTLLRSYRKIYSGRYPFIKDLFRESLAFDAYARGEATTADCRRQIPRRSLCWLLKEEYLYNGGEARHLRFLMRLGPAGFFKAIKLYLKHHHNTK